MDAAPKGGLIQKLCGKATVTVYHKVELGHFTGFAFLRGIDAADRACAVSAVTFHIIRSGSPSLPLKVVCCTLKMLVSYMAVFLLLSGLCMRLGFPGK